MERWTLSIILMIFFAGSCLSDCKKDSSAKEIVGRMLPSLVLPSSDGNSLKIPDDLLGSYTVLFFYPKDQTPGCTKEVCAFRDNLSRFNEVDAKVFGVSSDSIESHQEFIAKQKLNFPLLADEKKMLATALGVSTNFGIFSRDTFLIDPTGHVAMVWRKVDVTDTVFDTLTKLSQLKGQAIKKAKPH